MAGAVTAADELALALAKKEDAETDAAFQAALRVYTSAPRLEPMSPKVHEAMVKGVNAWCDRFASRTSQSDVYPETAQLFMQLADERPSAARGPSLLASVSDHVLAAMKVAWGHLLFWSSGASLLRALERMSMMIERETILRLSPNSRFRESTSLSWDRANAVLPYRERTGNLATSDEAAVALDGPYMYTDPVSGMQRRHDPTNVAHLRREVGLPPNVREPNVPSLRDMAFNALAVPPRGNPAFIWYTPDDDAASQLPASLLPELATRRQMLAQREIATLHAQNGRTMEAAFHTRNALAYEKQVQQQKF